ncbi:Polyprenyl synthetase [Trypanosoma melophagium]|uniref:Polyprenyl synthetase n=1 Tax=Trypanosoma melophagium TaxID=715481 RepID=UPI00351A0F02|nr:Polyprenyl synthetase [Trypanosoma melophagium]
MENEEVSMHCSCPQEKKEVNPSQLDLPQKSVPLQWWYFNAHLKDVKGEKDFSFFTSFFRQSKDIGSSKEKEFLDACTSALIDVGEEKYYADSLLDYRATSVIQETLKSSIDRKVNGSYLRDVVLDMVEKGRLPRPDRAMTKPIFVAEDTLKINYEDQCILEGEGEDTQRKYTLYHYNPYYDLSVDLEFFAHGIPILHGENGYVNEMFYYFFPRMHVKGKVKIGNIITDVVGDGWYDREYGGTFDAKGRDALDGWTWFSLRLSDDSFFSMFLILDSETKSMKEFIGVFTSNNERRVCRDIVLKETGWWTSLVSFLEYPVKFHLEVPSIELILDIQVPFNHQELPTLITNGGFYEGRIIGKGEREGRSITMIGFYEKKNCDNSGDVSLLLKNVGRFVRKTLSEFYPLEASDEWIAKNVLGRYCTGTGVNSKIICDTLFRPIRSIIDRGGKAWRSLVLVSGCNALSRNYFDCSKYIAIAELLHVGSLVIDDIQDESTVRRGGETVHIAYGVPTAINSGTACYFMAVSMAGVNSLDPQKANRIYDLYFDVMRAGHAGQGLDIFGLNYLMPEVVKTGNAQPLSDALKAIHTYKTGSAAAAMCKVACILCDANEEITTAMENFGLSLGLAFQIVDDALNVRGFEGDLKEAGEDIRDGKITYPVAKAMERLGVSERNRIWTILQERTTDCNKIKEVVDLLNSVNAIDDCLKEAKEIVDQKWEILDGLIEDSLPKIMMRSFCSFLTERKY